MIEKDDFEDLLHHPGVKPLLAEIDRMTAIFQDRMVKLTLDGSNEKELVYLKCRAEGAALLAAAIKTRLRPPKTLNKDKLNQG